MLAEHKICYWYSVLQKYYEVKKDYTISLSAYAKDINVDKDVLYFYQRCFEAFEKHKDEYLEMLEELKKSKLSQAAFIKTRGLNRRKFETFLTSIKYAKVIQEHYEEYMKTLPEVNISEMGWEKKLSRLKVEKMPSNQSLGFVEVSSNLLPAEIRSPTVSVHLVPPEVKKKPNDIELTVCHGVKVSISADIDSTTIIKIIEFLKEI